MREDLKIKVCGMREAGNMCDVASLGIDYMGFIFYGKSPRYVQSVPKVNLPSGIRKTGVFVNAQFEEIMEKCTLSDLQAVQLHGQEPPSLCARLRNAGQEVIKVISVADSPDFEHIHRYENDVDFFLLDTKTVHHGGSGRRFDWSLLESYQSGKSFFLSGGIRPGMVSEILAIKHPALAGIDLNSGFEDSPGIKSIDSLKKFIDEIRG